MTPLPVVSNRAAAETVCRHAESVADARLLLKMLGLVDVGGRELVPDVMIQVAANLQDGTGLPVIVRDRPSSRDLVPEGLRNLPPASPAPARPRRHYSLTEELEELELTDPDVAEAAAGYDRMVERITSKRLPEPDKDTKMPPTSPAERPAPVDLLARGLEHGSPRVRRLARDASVAIDRLVTALARDPRPAPVRRTPK